jgi:DmsE family decaheme c-type cytochrome
LAKGPTLDERCSWITQKKGKKMQNRSRFFRLINIFGALVVAGISFASAAADPPGTMSAPKKDLVLRGDATCTRCHDEGNDYPVLAIGQTKHGVKADGRTPTCTSCHGESVTHVNKPEGVKDRPKPDVMFRGKTKTDSDAINKTCLTCHDAGKRAHWSGSKHESQNLSCSNCHSVHVPHDKVLAKATQPEVCFACHKTERAQTHRISTHPLMAGKMACTDCHNPHGTTGPKLLVKESVNDTCYSCHAEKRGPFLWEHGPVGDDCTTCHTPHGSSITPLLKARAPWLCQTCHTGDHAKNLYSGANLPNGNVTTINGQQGRANQSPPAQANGRACLNCHVLVHGSNHPAGAKFQR